MILHNKKEIVPETPKVYLLPSSCNREGVQGDSNGESAGANRKENTGPESISKECILPH
jgi:hypothetical protein